MRAIGVAALIAIVLTQAFLYVYFLSLLSSMLNKRLVYHTRTLTYIRIQAVGVTNGLIKKA